MDRWDTLEQVRLGFNAGAYAMNDGGAALTADGGADLLPLIGLFNLAAVALNKAGTELKKQRDLERARRGPRVRLSWAALRIFDYPTETSAERFAFGDDTYTVQ